MDNEIVLNGVVYVRKECKCKSVFPLHGDRFGVSHKGNDRSYRTDVFECISSDEYRVVAKKIKGFVVGVNNYVFHRSDWDMQKVCDCIINSIP